jgi:hypothetical protein
VGYQFEMDVAKHSPFLLTLRGFHIAEIHHVVMTPSDWLKDHLRYNRGAVTNSMAVNS